MASLYGGAAPPSDLPALLTDSSDSINQDATYGALRDPRAARATPGALGGLMGGTCIAYFPTARDAAYFPIAYFELDGTDAGS